MLNFNLIRVLERLETVFRQPDLRRFAFDRSRYQISPYCQVAVSPGGSPKLPLSGQGHGRARAEGAPARRRSADKILPRMTNLSLFWRVCKFSTHLPTLRHPPTPETPAVALRLPPPVGGGGAGGARPATSPAHSPRYSSSYAGGGDQPCSSRSRRARRRAAFRLSSRPQRPKTCESSSKWASTVV